MIQIILGLIIAVIGFGVFYFYPLEKDTRKLTLGALLVVITLILKRMAIMVPFFGAESLKITLESLPLMLVGLLLSPSYAFLIALVADGLGLIIYPTGFPFLGFTLNTVLITLIPAVVKEKLNFKSDKTLSYLTKGGLLSLLPIVGIYLLGLKQVKIGKNFYPLTSTFKISLILGLAVIIGIVILSIYMYEKKLAKDDIKLYYQWTSSVLLVGIVVTFILTPMWLQIMYGIPFSASLFLRIVRSALLIPIDIVLGFIIYRFLSKKI